MVFDLNFVRETAVVLLLNVSGSVTHRQIWCRFDQDQNGLSTEIVETERAR